MVLQYCIWVIETEEHLPWGEDFIAIFTLASKNDWFVK